MRSTTIVLCALLLPAALIAQVETSTSIRGLVTDPIPAFTGAWGNSSFGFYEDPGANNWNVSISKNIRMKFPAEGSRLVFRGDLFNIWNHTQWARRRTPCCRRAT
jgi:hypothetical protein